MKQKFIYILAAAVLFAVQANSQGDANTQELWEIPEGTMTLQDAFSIALSRNPGLEAVEARIAGAEGTIKRAKSYLFPTIRLSANYTAYHSTGHPNWRPEIRASEDFNQVGAGLSFSWRLFNGLQDIHYLRAANQNLASQEAAHLEAQRILLEQVSMAFIRCEQASENMRIARSNFRFNEKLLKDAQARYEVGETPESDVLNFKLSLAQAKSNYTTAKRDFEISTTVIAQLLSVNGAKLDPTALPKATFEVLEKPAKSYESLLAIALKQRPDLLSVQAAIKSFEHQEKALKGNYLPSVDLVAGINYLKQNDLGTIDQDENDSNIGLRTNWTITNGGRRKAQILELRAQKNEVYHQYRQLLDQVESQLRQNLIDFESASTLYERQKEAETYAARIRELVEKSYKAGSSTITRLNEAQNQWTMASSAASAAKLQILMTWYRIESTTGQLLKYTQAQ